MTNKAGKIFAVAMVVLVGFGLRFYASNHLVIVQDEPIYLSAGIRYANHMRAGKFNMLAWEERNLEHPSLNKILYGIILLSQPPANINFTVDVKRFSPIENNVGKKWAMAGRYTSVVIGTLTVLVLGLLNPIAGLFLAIQSIAVLYTSSVYLEALPLFGSILCAVFYLKWFAAIQGSEKNNPRNHGWLFLSSGALGATTASKYIYCVVGLAIVIHYLIFATKKRILARTLGFMIGWGLFALFAFFVFDPYLWPHPKERLLTSLNYNREYSQSDDVKEFNYPFWQALNWLAGSISTTNPAFKQGMLVSLDTLISLLALGGLPLLWKKEPLYAIWLILGILVLFLWPTKWTQYTMIIMVPYCLSAAQSVGWIASRIVRKFDPGTTD